MNQLQKPTDTDSASRNEPQTPCGFALLFEVICLSQFIAFRPTRYNLINLNFYFVRDQLRFSLNLKSCSNMRNPADIFSIGSKKDHFWGGLCPSRKLGTPRRSACKAPIVGCDPKALWHLKNPEWCTLAWP